jgi:hypothetical protein
MADEAGDMNNTEKLAICIRYIHEGDIKERFLSFIPLNKLDAKSITAEIEDFLKESGLSTLLCIAQAYDGAATMSGKDGGVQKLFRESHPCAIYVHCYAHKLNLVICAACKAIPDATDFFETLEALYVFFVSSVKQSQDLKDVKESLGLSKTCNLVQLSVTRWACQIRAVSSVMTNYDALLLVLERNNHPTAIGLLKKISSWKFVSLLFVFQRLLKTTEGLHNLLQGESIDFCIAVTAVEAVQDTLVEMRSDDYANDLFIDIKGFCDAKGITIQNKHQRKRPARLENDFLLEIPLSSRTEITSATEVPQDQFRIHLFNPCIDRFLAELDSRFSSINKALLQGIQACSPSSIDFLKYEVINQLALHYNLSLSMEECIVAKNYLKRQTDTVLDILSVYRKLDNTMFPSLSKTLQIALTIPISSCSCERSFSALRRLRTFLRGTMTNDRLDQLSILSIERAQFQFVTAEAVIDRFALMGKRRHSLLL